MNRDDLSFKFLTFYRFSWLAFALYQPASAGAVYLVLYNQFDMPNSALLAFGVALFTNSAMLPVLLGGQKVLDKISNELLFKQTVIVVLVSAGAIRGLTFFYSAELFGFTNPTTLIYRMINSTANAVFFLLFWSVGIQKQRTLDARYRSFMVDKLISETKKYRYESAREINQALNSVNLMKSDLKSIVNKDGDLDSSKLMLAASKIDTVLKEQIKPMGERLYSESLLTPPKSKFIATLVQSVNKFNYSIRLTTGLILILSFFNWKSIYNIQATLISTFAATGLYLLPALLHRWYVNHFPNCLQRANRIFLLYLFSHSYLQYLISENFEIDYGKHPLVSVLILMPFTPGIALLSAWLKQSFADKRHLLLSLGETQALDEAKNLSTLEAMGISDRRMITAFLHNSVQSELQGLLKQLEKAVKTNSPDLSRDAMEKLTSYINRSARDDFEIVSTNPEKRFEKLLAAWDGIVSIESSLATDFFATHTYAPIVVEILEEFVTNGARHSGTSEVFISGKSDAKGFILTLTRNGEASKKGAPGLGTKLLESISSDVTETRLLNERTQVQIKL